MNTDIIIVSGLPRSGTALMMQLLQAGGIDVVTDQLRGADTDNPRGYFEFERVKKIKEDATWVPDVRGKAVKMISQLLYDLPATERYRVLFMQRELEEVLESQEKMLTRLGRTPPPRADIARAFTMHLAHLRNWLKDRPHIALLEVCYAEVVQNPEAEARRIGAFLGRDLDIAAAVNAVDPQLYRNRGKMASADARQGS
jgi:hypothetical protein